MQQFPFDLRELPTPTYLVGGWVRDRLLHRQSRHLDLDFVLPERTVETAQAIARQHRAGFVVLDADRQIARVVFANATADFAQQMGTQIEEDLGRRDFCMNAIAIECHELQAIAGESGDKLHLPIDLSDLRDKLIDPFDGQHDLHNQMIRMVAPENLAADPLRILRGYRQAAQLGFTFEELTRQVAIKFAPSLKLMAAERVCTELGYLLTSSRGCHWLIAAINDQILADWLPSQHLNLARFAQIESAIAQMLTRYPDLELFFSKHLAGDRRAVVIVKLAALTNSATALDAIGLSRAEQRWLMGTLRHLPHFIELLPQATVIEQYQFFQATLEFFPAIAALALASDHDLAQIAPWLERWLNPQDAIAYPVALVTGDDLRYELGIAPSPKLGELLATIKLAQVAGQIKTRAEAIALAQTLI